ncbi:chloride channel protein [Synechococcus sp. A18-25c]|uniref:chloride channel protein n=1 Tax=Synechococcus sp. A18-25c TaxID=1866938 RepID=UPI0021066444|nr:chloride channel protein [Synechococcus sp. A18-25c]
MITSSTSKPRSLLWWSLRALLAGAAGGAMAAVVVSLALTVQHWIWGAAVLRGLPSERPLLWCLLWAGGIGLMLSLLQRQQLDRGLPEMKETLAQLRAPEGLNTHNGLTQLLGGALALAGGGTLGPEALMTRLVAVGSHQIWKGADRTLVAAAMAGSLGLFHSPLVGGAALAGKKWQLIWRWLPGTIGGVAGFVAFHGLNDFGGGMRGVPYLWPTGQEQRLGAMVAAVLAGLVGWLAGQMMRRWRQWLRQFHLLERFWWTPIATGLVVGLCLWGLPLAAFSGENQLKPLVLGAWTLSTEMLVLSAIGKLLMVGLCLETGWRGGQFFPVILASSALGMGLHQWIPWIGGLDSWSAGVVGGSLSVLLSSPLLGLVLGLTLLQGHGAGALVIGLLVGQLLQRVH